MAETLDSADAFTTPPILQSCREGEIEESPNTDNHQNSGLLLSNDSDSEFSGHRKDSEVEMETLHGYEFVQDSPTGDVAYDAALVTTKMAVAEIQEPPSDCAVKVTDDGINSRNEMKEEEKFADGEIDSRAVTKQEGTFADDAVDSVNVKGLEDKFSGDGIDSRAGKNREEKCADVEIDVRTVNNQEEKLADDAVLSGDVKKQDWILSGDLVDLINVKKRELNSGDDSIDSSTSKNDIHSAAVRQECHFSDDSIGSRTVKNQKENVASDAIDSRTVNRQEKFEKCALKIQVIDETALIESPHIRKAAINNGKHRESQGPKEKRPRRRGSKAAKSVETSGVRSNECGYNVKKGNERRVYSRKEMEALRFVGLEAQKKKWIEIYCRLGPMVAKEYDELTHHNNYNATHIDFDPRPQFLRASVPQPHRYSGSPESDCVVVEEERSEDDATDEDYSSIQKPAFLVTGEPDFDSGPPQDGLEYLRRVRWETEHIPKVTVAKIKKKKAQTAYMPQIPDIMKCPDNLLPLKQWEDAFLADFSQLRLDLTQLELEDSSSSIGPAKSQPILDGEISDQLSISEDVDDLDDAQVDSQSAETTDGAQVDSQSAETTDDAQVDSKSAETTDDAQVDSQSAETTDNAKVDSETVKSSPTLSTVLKMAPVARVSMLKKRISSVENLSTLSRDDCVWLFALCAAVDIPLDADTCAALRSLLRKCASLRAAKSQLDDDVVMLNILITISGRYFGQLEN